MGEVEVGPRDLLLVIDVQNDFCSGGALAVPDGEAVVPVANRLMARFATVVLTQDWHPSGHGSFASSHPGREPYETIRVDYGEQVLWPDHCVQGSRGAAFHDDLDTDPAALIVRKGSDPAVDSYSALFENDKRTTTGLSGWLRERGVGALFLVGLATDFCVRYSALDARKAGFAVRVVEEGVRGIDLEGSVAAAWSELERAGALRVSEADLAFAG
jgi:nicotinamidase/pyrazinamidase